MDYLAKIQRAIDSIETNLREPITIERLARQAGFSYWHFQRIFAAVTGEPVAFYLRRRRLTEAAADLRTTRRLIMDIALDYQFESHEAFTRAFKSVFHLSPNEVRRRRHFIEVQSRLQLSPHRLRHLAHQITMKPVMIKLPALTLVGPKARFISALSPDANNLEIVPPLWHALMRRKGEVESPLDNYSYGACQCLPANQRTREDELVYLAGFSVRPRAKIPRGMAKWKIPALTYALFTHRGPVSRLSETINYANGSWLPRSKFQRVEEAPELERYDDRFCAGRKTSEMDYLIAVKPKRA